MNTRFSLSSNLKFKVGLTEQIGIKAAMKDIKITSDSYRGFTLAVATGGVLGTAADIALLTEIPELSEFTYVGESSSYINIDGNEITYKGGSGYEHLYVQLTVKKNTDITINVEFYSPTGFEIGGYGSNNEYIYVLNTAPTATSPIEENYRNSILGRSAPLSIQSAEVPAQYEINFNSGNNNIIYLVFDFGYIKDGTEIKFVVPDMSVTEG